VCAGAVHRQRAVPEQLVQPATSLVVSAAS
jgi:hypothetical protein